MSPREARRSGRGLDGRIIIVWQNSNSWSLPKGAVEDGENALEAAKREIWEETGVKDPEFIKELGSYERYSIGKTGVGEDRTRPKGKRTFFLFKTKVVELVPQETDVTKARWVTVDEALALLTHPKDAEFLKSVRGILE